MLTYASLLWESDFRRKEHDVESWEAGEDTKGSATEYTLRDHVTGQSGGPILCFKARF
ncbi:hypothetical protein F4677DRAFT_439259 [Hypoxylon crocopeplum]|nr:hypothetical protein F4677DRAFT_439259 [Hypoxylon crocopeplum]